MAVVRMKRLSAVIPVERKEILLSRLQDLGVLQPVPLGGTGELDGELLSRLTVLKRHRSLLASVVPQETSAQGIENAPDEFFASLEELMPMEGDGEAESEKAVSPDGGKPVKTFDQKLLNAMDWASAAKSALEARIAALTKEEEDALVWGQLCQQDLQILRADEVFVRVYRVRVKQADKVQDYLEARGFKVTHLEGGEGRGCKGRQHTEGEGEDEYEHCSMVHCLLPEGDSKTGGVKGVDKNYLTAVVISLTKDPVLIEFEELIPPARRMVEIGLDLVQAQDKMAQVEGKLAVLARYMDVLDREEARVLDEIQLFGARTGALNRGVDEHLFAITGWCPVPSEQAVRELVLSSGGGVLVADPGPDDEPPILLKNGPLVRAFEPLVKMFQLPNYDEADPTFLVAPFMGIFFGFCLGDIGYGLSLILLGIFLQKKFFPKASVETRKALNLLKVLGGFSMLVGLLMGSCFGITLYEVPQLQKLGLHPNMLLFQLNEKPEMFFYFSLALGVVQLVFGFLIKLVRAIRREMYQKALGVVGWITLFPGVAVWVLKGTPALFVAGMVLILLFENPTRKVGARIGSGAWALYNITGLFGDVMSYARIFGLGLSSGIIAVVINYMAVTVSGTAPVIGWIGALLILVIGHGFNFLMGVLGSLVHPARLQFLEFFGKFFEGGGSQYRPLQRHSKGG